jgi:cytochrome P450
MHELNAWPALLRPFIYRFLPRMRKLMGQVREAHRVIGKILAERRALKARGEAPEYNDAIEWFEQTAKGRKYDPVHVQLTLSFVAIHTTADMITQVMFDLAQNPEYIQPLREEVIEVLGKQGWKKTSLYNLKLLDSVLKESQRLRPINDSKAPFPMRIHLSFKPTLTASELSISAANCSQRRQTLRWHGAPTQLDHRGRLNPSLGR